MSEAVAKFIGHAVVLQISFVFHLLLFGFLFLKFCNAQQPLPPNVAQRPKAPPVYLLNLTPISGGKTYSLFRNTKVVAKLNDGTEAAGKIKTVSRDSIYIDNRNYAVADINEFRFNPGTALGAASAICACVGLATVAVVLTIDGGSSSERSEGENIALWTGAGLAVVGLAYSI